MLSPDHSLNFSTMEDVVTHSVVHAALIFS
jgi:hypothetical protein